MCKISKNVDIYLLGLSLIYGIGGINARKLIAYCGSAKAIFESSKKDLCKIPGIGKVLSDSIGRQTVLKRAEEELLFMAKENISAISYLDAEYPSRLKHCVDSPMVLFSKGKINFEAERVIAIVGTRRASSYGVDICRKIVNDLLAYNVQIVSGLAYGIDISAHKAAIQHDLPTVAVLGHGLDRVYPAEHIPEAQTMQKNGGIVSDFLSGTKVDPENFPRRNRIIAGLSDATLVVEATESGGALITANIANSYNREVFAVPGRVCDKVSAGCNNLIRDNKAALVTSAADIIAMMNWDLPSDSHKQNKQRQQKLFLELEGMHKTIYELLMEKKSLPVDLIALKTGTGISKILSLLLEMEMMGIIRALPGRIYELKA